MKSNWPESQRLQDRLNRLKLDELQRIELRVEANRFGNCRTKCFEKWNQLTGGK